MVMTPAQIHAIATESLMDRVVFSIDGATPESYCKYRVGGSFPKTLGKMRALVDACRAAGTWRKHVSDRPRRAKNTPIYILIEGYAWGRAWRTAHDSAPAIVISSLCRTISC